MNTVMGAEAEYAVTCDDLGMDGLDLAGRLHRIAAQIVPHLASTDGDRLFLENGGCIYEDCEHLEYATPECSNPTDLVRYVRAGDLILSQLADRLSSECGAKISVRRGNVGYGATPQSWACHESHLSSLPPSCLVDGLVPFLISRIIYCGGGGFDPFNKGISFSLSPRTAFITEVSSGESTCSRGIVHLKDEPLSNHGYHRLHLLCGDALGSEMGMWLRAGTTALVVRLLELGFAAPPAIVPRNPISALRLFASDPTLTVQTPTISGRLTTAMQIQQVYLQAIERSDLSDYPDWAPQVLKGWHRILELLQNGPQEASTALDWPIKLQLYSAYCARQDVSWDKLSERNIFAAPGENALRPKLLEAETKFLQSGGLFEQMESEGVLDHGAIANREGIVDATKTPPPGTRAQVRGEFVRLHSRSRSVTCSWHRITDSKNRRMISLDDPLSTNADWQAQPEPPRFVDEGSPQSIVTSLRHSLRGRRCSIGRTVLVRLEDALREGSLGLAYDLRYLALEGYCNGHYRVARSLQQILLNAGFEVPSTLCHLGRIALMTGNFQTALRHAGRAWRMREQAPDYVVPRILWLQAAVVLLQAAGSNSLGSIIGKFKTVMQTAYSCDWNLTPLLDRLGQRLEGQDYELLKAMSDAINDHDKLAELDAFPVWRTTAAEAVS